MLLQKMSFSKETRGLFIQYGLYHSVSALYLIVSDNGKALHDFFQLILNWVHTAEGYI